MSQTEIPKPAEQADKAAQPDYTIELKGVNELNEAIAKLGSLVAEKQTPKPQALLGNTEASQKLEESTEVKEQKRFARIASFLRGMANVKEDISSSVASGALGQIWSPDLVILPPDLPANLRRFVQVKEIPKGQKQINFVTITTAEFSSLSGSEDAAPADVSQTITEISAIPVEYGAKQRVSYIVMESATPDIIQGVERSFQAAALINEDNLILSALDAATPAATLYGDESVSAESAITSTMTFSHLRMASALREIQKKGYAVGPGDLISVLHPVQYDALIKDSSLSQYLYFGSSSVIQQAQVPQIYGVDVVRSTKVPTGTGSGSPAITTYHAQVFLKASYKGNVPAGLGVGGACALGVNRELLMEVWRRVDERDFYIVGSTRAAAAVLQPNALVHVYTA